MRRAIPIYTSILLTAALLLGGCAFTKKIKTGEMAYELKQYDLAVSMLEDEYAEAQGQSKARKAYLLGKSYQILKESQVSLRWYDQAVHNGYGDEAKLALAKMLKQTQQYDRAINVLAELNAANPNQPAIIRQLAICRQAREWIKNPVPGVQVDRMPFNSDYADYGVMMLEEDYIVFTSDRDAATGGDIYGWTGNKFSDLFVVHKAGDKALPYDGLLNTTQNDGTPVLTKDGIEMYFTRCFDDDPRATQRRCRLMYSFKDNDLWTEPEIIAFWDGSVSYGQPTLIENDSVLVFVANKVEGRGGFDLYYSVMVDGFWSEPYEMPATINTEGNEYFPTADGDTLYFSSDYLPGLGGLDIFKTYLKADGSWASPANMMPPINTGEDDFHYVVDRAISPVGDLLSTGYLSSSRAGDTDDDIYRWIRYRPKIDTATIAEVPDDASDLSIYLAGLVVTKQYADPDDPNSRVVGTQPVPEAYIKLGNMEGFLTDVNGRFIKEVKIDQQYSLRASKQGYLNNILDLSTSRLPIKEGQTTYTVNVEIPLDKIYTGVEIVLDNIYYDFNKYAIRKDAEPTLDELAQILRNNPQISIDLGSHTDCRGEGAYNQDLSQKRARSAVAYLIQAGIDASRLSATGYGESRPAVTCVCISCSEDEHQSNRRTTFKILD